MQKCILSILLFLPYFSFPQSSESWKNKVSDYIFNEFTKSPEVEYFIYLKQRPDLSGARNIKNKFEKGSYVYETLKTNAKNSQKDILDIIRIKDLKYKTYFITNTILVKTDYETMQYFAQSEQVKSITGNPNVKQKYIEDRSLISERSPNSIEWGIEMINADDMWNLGFTGSGVVIGGQDTGYRWTHEALQNKYRGWDGSIADHNYNWHDAIHAIDTHNSGSNPCGLNSIVPCDDMGHGTHTMGTMVGSSGSDEIGVAPDAKWIGCRNMERNYGTPSTYLECFEWFLAPTDLNNENPDVYMAPDVINNSWYCPIEEGCNSGNYSMMEDAVNALVAAGIFVVVSAGNSGDACGTISNPPAFFQNSFDVGATNGSDTIAEFSSRGPTSNYGSSIIKPNISAPGVSIRSSTNTSDLSYGISSGTSMAGPHVAGSVALLISALPELGGDVSSLADILQQSATYLDTYQICGGISGTQTPNNTYGYGRADPLAAYNYYMSLPLKIVSFEGKVEGNYINLKYNIENDEIFNYFLEKSQDAILWLTLDEILENGNFTDFDPINGNNFYRIKMVDENGIIKYSNIINIKFAGNKSISIYPNILKKGEDFFIEFKQLNSNIKVSIYDTHGSLLYNNLINEVDSSPLKINIKSLERGIYYIVITEKNNVLSREKIVIL